MAHKRRRGLRPKRQTQNYIEDEGSPPRKKRRMTRQTYSDLSDSKHKTMISDEESSQNTSASTVTTRRRSSRLRDKENQVSYGELSDGGEDTDKDNEEESSDVSDRDGGSKDDQALGEGKEGDGDDDELEEDSDNDLETNTESETDTTNEENQRDDHVEDSEDHEKENDQEKGEESEDDTSKSQPNAEELDLIANSQILAYRDFEEENGVVTKYLLKPRDQSHLHTFWATRDEMLLSSKAKSRLYRFEKKYTKWDENDEMFDPSYTTVERIISSKTVDHELLFFVKWMGLPYKDATWEHARNLTGPEVEDRIKEFERNNKIPTKKEIKRRKKPKPRKLSEFVRLKESPEFKNGNKLRDYQVEGFNWLLFCWFSRRNSILADEMGLGKTIQTITALDYLRCNNYLNGPFLIVVPLSTIWNWQREFEAWSDMNCVVYVGDRLSRKIARRYEWHYASKKLKNEKKLYKFNALLTTYENAIADTALSNINWEYLVVDEAHRLKNKKSRIHERLSRIKTDHTLLLTGTPLQNDLEELWNLLHFLDPKKFRNLNTFMQHYGELTESAQVDRLQEQLRPYLLRRMKEDVEKELPPKEETIIEVELTATQKTYYRAVLEKNRDFLQRGSKSVANLINVMMELRKCCNHPFLIKGVEENLTEGQSEKNIDELLIKCSSKMIVIDKLLGKLKSNNDKVLIFSQMLGALDIFEDFLNLRGYSYERLDGSVAGVQRQRSIDRFNQGDSFVFLLSTRAGGVGINLTAANTVIIFDSDWNPQNDIQAQSRCHRIGQKQEVKVFRLITRNTYEQYMMDSISRKMGLEKAVLHEMKNAEYENEKKKKKKKKQNKQSDNRTGLDKQEIESMLKHGAYYLYKDQQQHEENEKMLMEQDIDRILEKTSRTVRYDSAATQNQLSGFSKATFTVDDTDADIGVHDKDFWERILPEYKSPKNMMAKLDNGELSSEHAQEKFFKDLEQMVNQVLSPPSSSDPAKVKFNINSEDLWSLLLKVQHNTIFTEKQRYQAGDWAALLEAPRLRKRKVRTRYYGAQTSNATSKSQRLDDEEEDDDDFQPSTESERREDRELPTDAIPEKLEKDKVDQSSVEVLQRKIEKSKKKQKKKGRGRKKKKSEVIQVLQRSSSKENTQSDPSILRVPGKATLSLRPTGTQGPLRPKAHDSPAHALQSPSKQTSDTNKEDVPKHQQQNQRTHYLPSQLQQPAQHQHIYPHERSSINTQNRSTIYEHHQQLPRQIIFPHPSVVPIAMPPMTMLPATKFDLAKHLAEQRRRVN